MTQIAPGVFEFGTPAPVVPRPPIVTMYQARMALLNAGHLAAAEAAIAALPPVDRAAAALAWEFKESVSRTAPLVLLIGSVLGLTEAQIDALFVAAAQIT